MSHLNSPCIIIHLCKRRHSLVTISNGITSGITSTLTVIHTNYYPSGMTNGVITDPTADPTTDPTISNPIDIFKFMSQRMHINLFLQLIPYVES